MIYICFITDLNYVEEDGYGPLDHQSAAILDDKIKYGFHTADDCRLSVNVAENIAPPDILLPQETNLVLVHEPLISQENFHQSFHVKTDVELWFGARLKARRFLLCEAKLTEKNADEWIDFTQSSFSVVKSISIRREEPPRVLESDASFHSYLDYSQSAGDRSTLRPVIPEKLLVKSDAFPAYFRFDRLHFFGGDLLEKMKNRELLGLAPTGTVCQVEEV
ncbi:hypothetical protein ACMU_14405 [Actibacterium mucosum KCTC 23349]|uniref:Uncharacterized protein n=1 Tax=Actibacterium mucosum KCTC 23349 TaxID=1454373 RepID=A0A037ZER7_9RHOB|nr:hypothetical protein [Actibacterium mucosum]KAJ54950.1 hypothetical protein ACMU_14405 [Actibacterium mucosum KCTC 23349]